MVCFAPKFSAAACCARLRSFPAQRHEHLRRIARRRGIAPDGQGQNNASISRKTALANSARTVAEIGAHRNLRFCAHRSGLASCGRAVYRGRSSITRAAERSGCITDADARSTSARACCRHAVYDGRIPEVPLQSDRAGLWRCYKHRGSLRTVGGDLSARSAREYSERTFRKGFFNANCGGPPPDGGETSNNARPITGKGIVLESE